MKTFRYAKLTVLLSLISCCPDAYAAAFQFYEVGAPIIGTAGVGQAALANDASTAYFNPAGMTNLDSSELMLGLQFILPYTNFSPNSSNSISGNNGGSASLLAPGLGAYYVYHYSPKVSVGFDLNSPYGGALSYNNHWVGRYNVQQMMFYTVDANPTVAYQINPMISIGGGIVIEYANLTQTLAIPIVPALLDGQANIKVDNVAPGFNLGVLFTPDEATRIGVAYRSQIVHHLSGNTDLLNISATPTTRTKMVMPANIIASVTRALTSNITILGELGWANWSSMKTTMVTIDGFSAVTPNNWSNTYRAGIGGRFQVMPSLLVQTGVSYDSSPTTSSKRLPNLPVDGQWRFGAGLEYALIKQATLAASYEFMHLGSAPISNASSLGVLSGSYSRNYANVFQISLNVAC